MKVRSGKWVCRDHRSLPTEPFAVPARRWLVCLCLLLLSALPDVSYAQQGQNAVFNSGSPPAPTNSPSFFDATQFNGSPDACKQILNAFGALPTTGGTVDARGLISGTNLTLTRFRGCE
jgi:hypothetical protein